jgi:hypothetical protein
VLPRNYQDLTQFPGIGPKVALLVACQEVYGNAQGVPHDISTCVANSQPWVVFHQPMSPPLSGISPKRKHTTTKCVGQAWRAGFHVPFGQG